MKRIKTITLHNVEISFDASVDFTDGSFEGFTGRIIPVDELQPVEVAKIRREILKYMRNRIKREGGEVK